MYREQDIVYIKVHSDPLPTLFSWQSEITSELVVLAHVVVLVSVSAFCTVSWPT